MLQAIFVLIVELFLIFELVFLEVKQWYVSSICQDICLKVSSQGCSYVLLEAIYCRLNTQLKLEVAILAHRVLSFVLFEKSARIFDHVL